jgi:hypothetical protein
MWIPCQCCGKEYPQENHWFVCDKCGYRICPYCLSKHSGKYGKGYKCSQCVLGQMKDKKL